MNVKKYFTIVLCVVGICLAILSGVIVATKVVEPLTDDGDIEGIAKAPKDRANILILGVDKGAMRSDTIMLASLDNKNKKVSIVSIPRDTRVLDGREYDKITHLYSGPKHEQATIDAVKRITGIPIHYYVIADFEGFRDVIDVLDGVYVEVPDTINPKTGKYMGGMYYKDPEQKLDISLKKGYQLLNGKQAEGFVRFRSGYPDADLGRIGMQQYFVKELIKQKLQPKYLLKAPELYKQISKAVKTNYGLSDMASHLMTIKQLNPETDVQTFQLPGEGQMASTRYGTLSCFIYNQKETDKLMSEHFMTKSENSEPTPSTSPAKK